MGWDVALQGIGAGLQGALDAYSWQQEQQERKRQFDTRSGQEQALIDLRTNEHFIRLEEMMRELEEGRVGKTAREKFIANLPKEQRARAEAQIHGLNLDFDEPKPVPRKVVPVKTTRGGTPITRYLYEDELPGQEFEEHVQPRTPPAPRDEPLERIRTVGPDGRPVTRFVPRSEAAGQSFPEFVEPRAGTAAGESPRLSPSELYGGEPARPRATRDIHLPTSGKASTPITSRPTASTATSVARPKSLGSPALDAEAFQLVKQFDASRDADERAAIQYRMRQMLNAAGIPEVSQTGSGAAR